MADAQKKLLMVIAPEKFRDEELNHPRDVFEKAGIAVTVASTKTGELKGMLGHVEKVDTTLDDVAGKNFDAVVVVGGAGSPAYLWDNVRLREIVTRHHGLGKLVAAICLSGVVLARAGLITGLKATVFKTGESMKAYSDYGVSFVEEPVVTAGNIITANGPAAARQFGHEVAKALGL